MSFILDLRECETLPAFMEEGDPKEIPVRVPACKTGYDFIIKEESLPAEVIERWNEALGAIIRASGRIPDDSKEIGFNVRDMPSGASIHKL